MVLLGEVMKSSRSIVVSFPEFSSKLTHDPICATSSNFWGAWRFAVGPWDIILKGIVHMKIEMLVPAGSYHQGKTPIIYIDTYS